MKVEEFSFHFVHILLMTMNPALHNLSLKTLFWFLSTSVFSEIQTSVAVWLLQTSEYSVKSSWKSTFRRFRSKINTIVQFYRIFIDLLWLVFLTYLNANGAKWSVNKWASSLNKVLFKDFCFTWMPNRQKFNMYYYSGLFLNSFRLNCTYYQKCKIFDIIPNFQLWSIEKQS